MSHQKEPVQSAITGDQVIHIPTFREKVFGFRVISLFNLLLIVEIPFIVIVQFFLDKSERDELWRLAAHRNCNIFLKLWGIDLEVINIPRYQHPVIYSSNHPSMIDGFILFGLLGPNVVALTAPFTSFGFPFNYWFKNMGFIDIQRDADDIHKHPKANTRDEAFKKIFNHVKQGHSLLIFPEGHVERTHKLHYVHTGVARIALRAKVPVQVLSIVGMEKLFFGGFGASKGKLQVRFGRFMDPPAVSKLVPFRKVVKAFSKDIERAIVSIIPLRYLPEYYNATGQNIAVFVDIDNTLYNGYSMKDFVRYLLKKKSLSKWLPLKVLFWVILEKIHIVSHNRLMKISLGVLGGFEVKHFNKLCEDFFNDVAVHKINHHLLPDIKDHQEDGHVVIIVSEVVHPLANLFKKYLEASASIDTVLLKKDGVYTGEVESLNYGFSKAEHVEEFAHNFNINVKKSYAYADSISDLPLLYSVRYKTVVNPDKKLKKVAQKNNWPEL